MWRHVSHFAVLSGNGSSPWVMQSCSLAYRGATTWGNKGIDMGELGEQVLSQLYEGTSPGPLPVVRRAEMIGQVPLLSPGLEDKPTSRDALGQGSLR